jgi:simple sugar transport system ATP-binding protein
MGATPSPAPVVELRGIRKTFGDLVANDGVDLTLRAGEVHALLGENGAGKSTLMRGLYGLVQPDAGQVLIDGRPTSIGSPRDAIAAGIGMVTQHFALVRPMTVTENVMLSTAGLGRVDMPAARARVRDGADRLGVSIDPDAPVERLSIGEQQRVEILKALVHDCRVLLLDEPTAVLVPQDVEALFATLRRLTAQGLAVLFTSHKLHEVSSICDRVTVLRRGRLVTTRDVAGAEPRELAELMVGRPVTGVARDAVLGFEPDESPDGRGGAPRRDVVLRVSGLSVPGRGRPALDRVGLDVRAGEVLGVAGVSGNGQRELVDVLTGMRAPVAGTVQVDGVDVTGADPRRLMHAGVGRIPEDRHESVVADLSVEDNLVLEHLDEFRRGPFLDRRRIRAHAARLIEEYAIKAAPGDTVGSLSGGNMQKVLLARVLARGPRLVVVAQPTRGLDVGATEYVHRELLRQRERGAAVLLVSEDLDELLALSDRLVVLTEGRVAGTLPVAQATPERLGLLMGGSGVQEAVA